jgi:hypothetical protein
VNELQGAGKVAASSDVHVKVESGMAHNYYGCDTNSGAKIIGWVFDDECYADTGCPS